jgi:hypothetical protein
MDKKLDQQSFFTCTQIWGALLALGLWTAHRFFPSTPTAVTFCLSLPFSIALFGAMYWRLADLKWPRILLLPVVLTYVWLFANSAFLENDWSRPLATVLGIYSAAFWLLISFLKGREHDG